MTANELADALTLLQSPFGDMPDRSEHEKAVAVLLSSPDRAQDAIVSLLQSGRASNPYALLEVLPLLGDPASIPLLAGIMANGPANLGGAAAQSLARFPDPAALDALLAALGSPAPDVAVSAAMALENRGSSAACPALRPAMGSAEAAVRYQATRTALALGCLDAQEIASLAHDHDPDVRSLVEEFR